MKIYIGNDYKCNTSNDGTMREYEVEFFDNKCPAFIEGYRYIPDGETWTNANGVECSGISPWQDYNILSATQAQYELMLPQITEMQTALDIFTGSNL